jgi:hypothetical protein
VRFCNLLRAAGFLRSSAAISLSAAASLCLAAATLAVSLAMHTAFRHKIEASLAMGQACPPHSDIGRIAGALEEFIVKRSPHDRALTHSPRIFHKVRERVWRGHPSRLISTLGLAGTPCWHEAKTARKSAEGATAASEAPTWAGAVRNAD